MGIVRVEREITKAIHRHFPDLLVPLYLDRNHNRWMTVGRDCLEDILSEAWVASCDPDGDAARVHRHLKPFSPREDDRVVTAGSDWSFQVPDRLKQLYGSKRVMVAACYDLIPLLFPEFTPGTEFHEQFDDHYRAVARLAQAVFAISEVSAQSLADFWAKNDLSESAPPIKVVPLAAPIAAANPPALDDDDEAILSEVERDGPYIIYVSTIEPRKNHQLLLDIWRELYAERGKNCPKLLFVGMRGWGSNDLLRSASRMNAFKAGKIVWKEGLSDALLSQLYARSLFAVFPSYFEGWGLAATEAGAHGKICVISNTGALIEATQGTMPNYHPLDFPGWKTEIIRLLDDDAYRNALERKLDTERFGRTWRHFGDDFCLQFLDS